MVWKRVCTRLPSADRNPADQSGGGDYNPPPQKQKQKKQPMISMPLRKALLFVVTITG